MDYFNYGSRRRGASAGEQDHDNQQPRTGARYVPGAPSFESLRAPSNIRIRRLPSYSNTNLSRPVTQEAPRTPGVPEEDPAITGRRRSSSAPQRPNVNDLLATDLQRQSTMDARASRMPAIREGEQITPRASMHPGFPDSRPVTPGISVQDMEPATPPVERIHAGAGAMHSAGAAAQRNRGFGLSRYRSNTASVYESSRPGTGTEYESDVIDLLDLVDPEVRTIGTLTNLQNSLFVPDLGGLVNRRPTYDLSSRRSTIERPEVDSEIQRIVRSRAGTRTSRIAAPESKPIREETAAEMQDGIELEAQDSQLRRKMSVSSELSDSHYAVLPHGVSLEGWTEEDIAELNDHVRHLLHSKREGFKRSMRGFKQYISKPLGLFVFVYATCVTLFGAAWVFALIGWIYVADRQDYIINVIDLVLVALFALMGDGLAPFRAVDTYHMCFIAHYHHLTWRLRKEKQLPALVDRNDLPHRRASATSVEFEDAIDRMETAEYSVLTPRQQKRLQYHQAKFNKSHTFYKPHETTTHHAFPLRLMIAAVVLLDCHSLLQVALGTCTWSIDYHVRPEALTATILSCSITCNIAAGVVISIGDHKTRKKDVLERMFRQSLTEQAMKRMAKKHDRGDMSLSIDRRKVESGDFRKASQAVNGTERLQQKSKSNGNFQDSEEYLTPNEHP